MIRLTALELINFKSVEFGRIELSSWKNGEEFPNGDIVGIYGQNASGKTSVVKALEVLKYIFRGFDFDEYINLEDCISEGKSSSTIRLEAIYSEGNNEFKKVEKSFIYTLTLRKKENKKAYFEKEALLCKELDKEKSQIRTLIDYEVSNEGMKSFSLRPQTAWNSVSAIDSFLKTDIAVTQKISYEKGCSLIFSDGFLTCIKKMSDYLGSKEKSLSKRAKEAIVSNITPLILAILAFKIFAIRDFAVIGTFEQAGSMINHLRISTHSEKELIDDSFVLDIDEPAKLTEEQYKILDNTINEISPVLGSLVPGLLLEIEKISDYKNEDGSLGAIIEIVSKRGEVSVPLRYESEGIKKLVSILVLLIDVYSKPGSCVVIDELDSSIFEFLLGELIQVLNENGRGQLIFTAHNLRPLEILNSGSLVFTTTNPKNRYTKFKGIRTTNNLRDQYLRAINLGGLPETVYEPTNKFDIDGAFHDAGISRK